MPSPGKFLHATLAGALILVFSAPVALAWRDSPDPGEDANAVCKLEPEAQCTQAIRIGLQAPGVDMNHASMANMRLDESNLKGANLEGAILQLANLRGANLEGANLSRTHLHAVNLRGANLRGASLRGANLLDADLTGADLTGADLVGTILIQAKFGNATWSDGRICAADSVGRCGYKF